jgi:Ni/Fe-hydrogenase subunit HybB-like protein
MKSALFASGTAADRLLRLGGIVTVIGMILSLIAMSPAVFGEVLAPIWWALSMTTGLGLTILLVGVRRASAARSRAVQELTAARDSELSVGEK